MAKEEPDRKEGSVQAAPSYATIPPDGEWPCQMTPAGALPVRMVAFMYRLLRDGAAGPGDVESHLLQARLHDSDPSYTNCHLEMLARAHVTWMLRGPRAPQRGDGFPRLVLALGASTFEEAATVMGGMEEAARAHYIVAVENGQSIHLVKDWHGGSELVIARA